MPIKPKGEKIYEYKRFGVNVPRCDCGVGMRADEMTMNAIQLQCGEGIAEPEAARQREGKKKRGPDISFHAETP